MSLLKMIKLVIHSLLVGMAMQFDEKFAPNAFNIVSEKRLTKADLEIPVPIFDAGKNGNLRIKKSHGLGAAPSNHTSEMRLEKGMEGMGGPLLWFPLSQSDSFLYNPSYVDYTTQVPNGKTTGKMNTNANSTRKSAPLTLCERL
jgi:hypothetical protein